jgi:copper chaperone CopZ
MKVLLALILLAAGALVWVLDSRSEPTFAAPEEVQTYAPAPTVLLRSPAEGQVQTAFDVEGMCCTSCTGKLHARLVALPGVQEAAVDFETSSALVIAGAEVGVEDLQAALTFGKYSATQRGTP